MPPSFAPMQRLKHRRGVLVAAVSVAIALVTSAGAARAQTTTPEQMFSKADFTVAFRDKNDKYLTGTELDIFFNRVNCACAAPVTVEVRLQPASRAKFDPSANYESKLRAGDDTCVCVGASCGAINCRDISLPQNAALLLNTPLDFRTNVRALFEAAAPLGADPSTVCDIDRGQSLWFWMDTSRDDDMSTDVTDVTVQIQLDGRGPPAPTGVTVSPGNQALAVSWNSLGQQSDLQGYQVLCSRGADLPPFKGVFSPAFNTDTESCLTNTVTVSPLTNPASDVSTNSSALQIRGEPPRVLSSLNPDFLCTDLLANQTNARLFRLQNDVNYVVGVISIDKRGNPSPLVEAIMDAPKATQDFYSGYKSAGGESLGGCSIVGTDAGGSALGMGGILIGLATAITRSLRRRARRRGGV
jgi:hypothetical protein